MIQFRAPDGKRRSIRLGKVPKKQAETFKAHVERILEAKFTGTAIVDDTAKWLRQLADVPYEKLASVGLAVPRESATLGAFIDDYIAKRTNVETRTASKYRAARKHLVDYFGEGVALRDVTPGDADEWRLAMIDKGLSESSSVPKYCSIARQFFNAALRKRLISENPFSGLPCSDRANDDRKFFIPLDMAYSILDQCTDAEWALIFALGRFGGLRGPCEYLVLEWEHIDWEKNRFTVLSPKTGKRDVPIFVELRPYLSAVYDAATERNGFEKPTGYVVSEGRRTRYAIVKALKEFTEAAGFELWPKPLQNLRSSRQTELEESFPTHVVCRWVGNSPDVAMKNYLQITDEHFERAQKVLPQRVPEGDAKDNNRMLQPTASENAESCRKSLTPQEVRCDSQKPTEMQDGKDERENKGIDASEVVLEGLEPSIVSL